MSHPTPSTRPDVPALLRVLGPALRALLAAPEPQAPLQVVTFDDSPVVMEYLNNAVARKAQLAEPVNPKPSVCEVGLPLWFDLESGETPATLIERLRGQLAAHQRQHQYNPRIILVPGLGLFAAGADAKTAQAMRQLYLDKIQKITAPGSAPLIGKAEEARGLGVVAEPVGGRGRVRGKIAIVTGAAQGFGLEIAQSFAAEGGHVVLTDINEAGAQAAAAEICRRWGSGRAIGLAINVTSSVSIGACVDAVIRHYGGCDVLISNAGVLKAESVKTQSEKDFDFVTAVNYKGYFFCVQQVSPVLATQHQAKPNYRSDIIQINSKSGLVGSNKNGAYAGSKFGGIGLTQSFALELITDGIKVNSICPGNFFDGPLWSDPNNGLFVQYLRTGKVPGAQTIADVQKFYESKVPMGRGCTTPDVMTAVYYLIDQVYETGQAVPVTGGQVMLA
ncbi:MAG: SDR family NAD(P)-dependent oxidoreductase [Phycisphaerae bacterium]